MADPAHRRLTVREFLALQDDELEGRPELIGGELVYRGHARMRHSSSQGRLVRVLGEVEPWDPSAPGWWILVEQDWIVDERNVVRCDVGGWRRERLPTVVEGPIDLRPDWVCELLSPGHEARDKKTKSRIYLDAGVPWYWIADPEEALVQVYENAGRGWFLQGTYTRGDTSRIPPFEELEIDLDRLFLPRSAGA